MSVRRISSTSIEPVSLDEAKAALRVEPADTSDDARIGMIISAARSECETLTRRSLIDTTWEITLDTFHPNIRLEFPRTRMVESVSFVDTSGMLAVLDPSDYFLDAETEPNYLLPVYGKAWPASREQANAVKVRYIAGFAIAADGDAAAQRALVPADLRMWMILRIQQLHGGCDADTAASMRGHSLLDMWRVYP